MDRRRAHSASAMRPSSAGAISAPQINQPYYKPAVQDANSRPIWSNLGESSGNAINTTERPSSSVGSRIRTALDQSYNYVNTNKTMSTSKMSINTSGTMTKATAEQMVEDKNDLEDFGMHATTTTQQQQQFPHHHHQHHQLRAQDSALSSANVNRLSDADFETTPATAIQSISRPSVDTTKTTGLDSRGNSLDDFPDDLVNVDVGLSTVPNKYCTVREALELKKLLLLSKGSRGGIVPSSSAVMDMYMVGNVIGVGSYGKVRSAWHRLTGGKVAIKTYDKSRLKDQSHWKRVHSEIKVMELVSHPRIARMYEAVETPKRLHLIMECVEGGNLCSYVKQKKKLHEMEAKKIFFQLMLAIEYLHAQNVAHRDIKLENVLFTEARDVKLIDFGFSTISKPGTRIKIFCGTPSYMAPEIVLRTEYEGPPVDLWSAGVLLYACLCGQFPFRAQSYPDLYRRIARGSFAVPEDISLSCKDLLRSLLSVDASLRPTASAVLKHPWLQAQMVVAPDIGRLRHDTIILISENPSDDIDNQAVTEIVRFGISREEVIRLIMTKTHSNVSTLYYLFLDALFATRQQNGVAAPTKPNSSSIQQGAPVASGSSNPQGMNKKISGADLMPAARKENDPAVGTSQQQQTSSTLGMQFLLKSAGGAGVLNLRPRSASASSRTGANASRPLSANLMRR